MILPQIAFIPTLYVVQEVTLRLGIFTQQGHGERIREHFGGGWPALPVGTLFVASLGALTREFSGIAGVGSLFGIPAWQSVSAAVVLLVALGVTHRRLRRRPSPG